MTAQWQPAVDDIVTFSTVAPGNEYRITQIVSDAMEIQHTSTGDQFHLSPQAAISELGMTLVREADHSDVTWPGDEEPG